VVHRNILLVGEAWIAFILIHKSDVRQLAPEPENPWAVQAYRFFRTQSLSCGKLGRGEISPFLPAPEFIHRTLRLSSKGAEIPPDADPTRKKEEDVDPTLRQHLEHREVDLKPLRIDEGQSECPP
jgi:hypothetical protein